jgi:aryl-alcohol dehydrogenase-like predicted oxidoreductase
MEYTTLGRTGATVSRLGFGGATLGLANYVEEFDPADPATHARSISAIEAALEAGVNYYDTAPGYGDGTSERVFGEALRGVTSAGDHPLFVATKVSPQIAPDDLRAAVEGSLERLGRDRIELLQLHGSSYSPADVDRLLGPGGLVDRLGAIRDEGLIGAIGFTSEDTNDGVYRLIRSGAFDAVQLCYNLIYQHPYDPSRPFGSMLVAEEHGLGVITMRTSTSGIFQRWVQAVNPANTFDYTPALIQFVLSNPLVDVALVGMRTPEQVRSNVALVDDLSGRVDLHRMHDRYV